MSKKIILILIFVTGFTFYDCCQQHDSPTPYFDIKGFKVVHFENYMKPVVDSVEFVRYDGFQIIFDIDYVATLSSPVNFSFINNAFACQESIGDGQLGSRDTLTELTVITLNDFDSTHLANDTINDLYFYGNMNIDEYVALRDSTVISFSYLGEFELTKMPELNNELHIKVRVGINNKQFQEFIPNKIKLY